MAASLPECEVGQPAARVNTILGPGLRRVRMALTEGPFQQNEGPRGCVRLLGRLEVGLRGQLLDLREGKSESHRFPHRYVLFSRGSEVPRVPPSNRRLVRSRTATSPVWFPGGRFAGSETRVYFQAPNWQKLTKSCKIGCPPHVRMFAF